MNITTIIGTVAALIAIGIFLYGTIDKRIENKINKPEFIKKVASEVRIPLLIFDDNEHWIYDTGASEYIAKITIEKDENDREIKQIIVYPKKMLPVAPFLISSGALVEFHEPERINQIDWKFDAIERSFLVGRRSSKPLTNRFRLEIIK